MRSFLLLAMVAASACAADEPPAVEKLIEQLGSASFPARERAMKQLRDRGPGALPALRKALETKDEEVRKRVESLIPPLEIEEALLPKRVTLKASGQPTSAAVADLAKQTGYKLAAVGGDVGQKLTADLKDVPFWEAVERVARESGRSIAYDGYQKVVQLDAAGDRSAFVNVRGPFRLEATWFHEDRDVDFTMAVKGMDGRRSHKLTLSVSVLAEPRLTFLKVQPAKVQEALDSDGKSLLEPVPPAPEEPPPAAGARKPVAMVMAATEKTPPGRGTFRGESTSFSDIRLRRAGEMAKTAKVIRGTIPVRTVLIRRPVVVTNKVLESTGTSFRAGQESLQITRVQNQGGGSLEVQILIPYERNRDWSQVEKWYQRFHVEDDSGNRFQDHGRGSSSNGNQYWISMYYGAPNGKAVGPPTKLVFEDWVVHDHAIPFEFKDVPLP
jgi:hypothetical protein